MDSLERFAFLITKTFDCKCSRVRLGSNYEAIMTFQLHTVALSGDTPGTTTNLAYYTAGPSDAAVKVYMQAALHADR